VLNDLELSEGRLTINELEMVVLAVASRPELFEDLVVDDGPLVAPAPQD
jgi:hypothetical protein